MREKQTGFTLIELLVVMAILATLLSFAAPKYIGSVEKAKEATLRVNLATLRDVIDKYYGDTGKYPAKLDDLVSEHYIKKIPIDPITDSNQTWVSIPPSDEKKEGVFNVTSGSKEKARDGSFYREW